MLDGLGAAKMRHREIAALVSRKFKIGDWWSQSVTVGYERIKGRRAIGQRLDGRYEAGKSRTFGVPVDDALRRLGECAAAEAVAD